MFLKLVGTYIIFTSTPLVTELLNCHVFKVSRNLYHLHLNPPWWRSPWIVMFLKLVGTYIIFTSTPLVTELLNCHIFKVSRNLYHLHLNPPPLVTEPLNCHVFKISRNLYHLHLNPPGDGAPEAWIVMFLKLVGTYIIFTSTPLVTEPLNCHLF